MLSPYNRLLNTNDIPTEEETLDVQTYCSEIETRREAIRKRLKELDIERAALTRDIDALEEQYSFKAHKSILSPIRRLPTELLQSIFSISSPKAPVLSCREAPLIYGHVCSRWRSVSLAMPELWATLHVVIPRPMPCPDSEPELLDRLTLAVTEWICRAQELPLDLRLVSNERRPEDASYAFSILCLVLLNYGRRLKGLRLDIPSFMMNCLIQLPLEELPLLASLEVSVSDYSAPPILSNTFVDVRSLPSLRKVSFNTFCVDLRTQLPLGQLTHLDLRCTDNWCSNTPELISVLGKCEQLVDCRVAAVDSQEDLEPFVCDGPVTLPKLQRLRISAFPYSVGGPVGILNLCDFFSNINTPLLEVLKVNINSRSFGYGPPSDEVFSCIQSLFERCLPPLHTLKLGFGLPRVVDPAEAIPQCLRRVPTLRKLVMEEDICPWDRNFNGAGHPRLSAQVLECLTITPDTATVCPVLEVLRLNDSFAFSEDAIHHMLKSRSEPQPASGIGALRDVSITTRRKLCEEISALPFVKLAYEPYYTNSRDYGRDWSDHWRY